MEIQEIGTGRRAKSQISRNGVMGENERKKFWLLPNKMRWVQLTLVIGITMAIINQRDCLGRVWVCVTDTRCLMTTSPRKSRKRETEERSYQWVLVFGAFASCGRAKKWSRSGEMDWAMLLWDGVRAHWVCVWHWREKKRKEKEGAKKRVSEGGN